MNMQIPERPVVQVYKGHRIRRNGTHYEWERTPDTWETADIDIFAGKTIYFTRAECRRRITRYEAKKATEA